MDSDLVLLNHKLDLLSAQVEAQRQQLEELEKSSNSTAELHRKLDAILEHVAAQRHRQEELNELKDDLIPIVNHMVKLSIDELAEIGSDFQLEDLLFLVKRLLRDTQLLVGLLDRFEAAFELAEEAQVIGKQAFNQTVAALDRLERAGYFSFARSLWRVVEKIVNEYSEKDVNALGDNIVLILDTVRDMTQPEIMSFLRKSLLIAEREIEKPVDISYTGLLRELRDPAVRRGLALTLRVLHVIGAQASGNGKDPGESQA